MATQSRIKECGVWFDRQFYAGDTGMEIWMSRNGTSLFRDMRWEVICGTRRVLAIRGNPHSWSEKRGRFLFLFMSFLDARWDFAVISLDEFEGREAN